MWISPEIDLLSSNPVLKWHISRPSGNILELCNLDSYLNIDFHKGVDCHVRYTDFLHELDPAKFIIATPKKGTPDYLQIFDSIDGVYPSSEYIISNTYDVLHQSSVSWRPKATLSQMSIMWKTRRRGGGGEFGGVRTPIMGERGCGWWLKISTVESRRIFSQICTWRKGNVNKSTKE